MRLGTLSAAGLAYLALAVPHLAACAVAAFTLVTYVGVYTPLKTRTTLNTLIGAVPGALPPVIGWCAARGALGADAWVLFGVLFLWQLPHFMAIAWMYRDDYARGGLRMVSVADPGGTTLFSRTSGVRPTASRIVLRISTGGSLGPAGVRRPRSSPA